MENRIKKIIPFKHEVNLGLGSDDYNWLLLEFIDSDTLSRLPLNANHIDRYASKLNWDIMSSKQLAGWIFVKYKDKINWEHFLQNGKPKELIYLRCVKDKLQENQHLFFKASMKKMYYTVEFIAMFPEFIDWNWCVKHIKLTDFLILKYWNNFKTGIFSRYHPISMEVVEAKKHQINWSRAVKNILNEEIIDQVADLLNWDLVCKYQTLSEDFLYKHKNRIINRIVAIQNVCRYQRLSEKFILNNIRWLDREMISQYQNYSFEFLQKNISKLDLNALSRNSNFNQEGTIQIINQKNRWYIIDESIASSVQFCSIIPF